MDFIRELNLELRTLHAFGFVVGDKRVGHNPRGWIKFNIRMTGLRRAPGHLVYLLCPLSASMEPLLDPHALFGSICNQDDQSKYSGDGARH